MEFITDIDKADFATKSASELKFPEMKVKEIASKKDIK